MACHVWFIFLGCLAFSEGNEEGIDEEDGGGGEVEGRMEKFSQDVIHERIN